VNHHFTKPGFSFADLQALVDAVHNRYSTGTFKQYLSTGASIVEVKGTDLRTEGAPVYSNTVVIAGIDNSDMVPPGTNAVITARTALRGRSYRGRTYFGGLGEARLDSGIWNAAMLDAIEAFLVSLQDDIIALGWAFVVLSRWHAGIKRALGLGQAVTGFVSRSQRPASQRKRNKRP
jgi:hypothetical protein